MSPQGGNLAQRLVQNAQKDGFGPQSCPTDEDGRLIYGIRLLSFRGESDETPREGFKMPDIDILPHEMNLDIKIDGPHDIGIFDLLAEHPLRRMTDQEKVASRLLRRCNIEQCESLSLTDSSSS